MKTVSAFSRESQCVVRRALGARKLERSGDKMDDVRGGIRDDIREGTYA